MKSTIIKRSIIIRHRKTSASLEDEFWGALKEIAPEHDMTLSDVVDTPRFQATKHNLPSLVRLFVLDFFRGICQANPRSRGPESSVGNIRKVVRGIC
jgi:predicted DNA-binding ribbon-helix-helix protein